MYNPTNSFSLGNTRKYSLDSDKCEICNINLRGSEKCICKYCYEDVMKSRTVPTKENRNIKIPKKEINNNLKLIKKYNDE